MRFRTEYTTRRLQGFLDPSRRVVMLGSCFTDNIGARIMDARWPATVNPCGTLFNPLSIARVLTLACLDEESRRAEVERRLFEHDSLWRSWDFSTLFAAPNRDDCLTKCMTALAELRTALEDADALILTLGTAWVYRLADTGEPVANCHKLPERTFTRHLEDVATLSRALAEAIAQANRIAPKGLKLILTLSPVRHLRDGMAGNSLSKATLRLAIDSLLHSQLSILNSQSPAYNSPFSILHSPFSNNSPFSILHSPFSNNSPFSILNSQFSDYFPAYEILTDDLRDYRFYADDLLHPSPVAVQYIWEAFQADYLTPEARDRIRAGEASTRRAAHRPLH